MRRQADWLCNVDIEHIQPVRLVLDPCEKPSSQLADPHHDVIDGNLVARLVELPDAQMFVVSRRM